MGDRGSALLEAVIVTAIAGVIWATAAKVLAELPPQAARWEEAAAARQRVRAIETRVARMAAPAGPIELEVAGERVRVPAIWPRRLGLLRPGAAGEVSTGAVTFVSRVDGHRALVLVSALGPATSSVAFATDSGCGAAPACGLRAGDLVLAVTPAAVCGLFRIAAVGPRLDLEAIMEPATPMFGPGSVVVPVFVDTIFFDPAEGALRRYDGYRSDNVMVDGLRSAVVEHRPHAAAALGDGPFVGTGALGYDVDQLSVESVGLRLTLAGADNVAAPPGASLSWRMRRWP